MDSASEERTSTTLLGRLRCAPTDQAAWAEFVERYGPRIYGWCRHWKLQEADARDATQDVLARLARKMATFAYDPAGSFRGWLRTLTRHACADLLEERKRPGTGSGDSRILELLESVAARDDLVEQLDELFDRELLEEALARVRLRVEAHTWEAFRLLALEGCTGAQAAAALGIKVATALVARSKVQKLVRAELRKLEGSDPAAREATA
jgi:RNA polymerase sigma-70 factor (ECF subfamily)